MKKILVLAAGIVLSLPACGTSQPIKDCTAAGVICTSDELAAYNASARPVPSAPAVTTPSQTRFEKAVASCTGLPTASLADEGKTINVTSIGKDNTATGTPLEAIVCGLEALNVPTSTVAKIDRTTSLQGVQTDTWDGIEASWTYHPDNGLGIILVDKS
jgi:hypothetical protein